uniref:NADH-ubiquinone oxidoreductase chain 4 n=1 Tax=Magicicada cassinii TaxID=38086 RepID=A0A482DQ46_9HEMI|nr:NADH dehydrogenase subunit 4 [Magicicada cassinii]
MLKLILFSLFLTPLLFNMWLLSNMLILLMLFIILFFSKDLIMLSYNMYMDNISYGLIILTIWITFLMINSSPLNKYNNMNLFLFMVLLLMTLLILSFCSYNIMMFYIFFETSLIPTMIIIMGWGYQPERVNASYYLLFYTLFASLPMLVSIMFMYSNNMTNIMMLMSSNNSFIYLGMTLAFMVKVPLFMCHFWLPKAHVEAPVSGSMILAGILLKLGTYGLIRVMYIMPMMFINYSFIWISISLMGGISISLSCMMQIDMKSMIAYSSVAHMSLVIGGIMTMNMWGMVGAYFMMIGHGLCSSALFCLVNISYERSGSRSILINKGMLSFMPSMTLMWFLMSSSNISCPPTISLVGEIMILNSLMSWNPLCMIFLSFSSFLSACYSLYLYSHTQHGMIFSGCYSFNSGNVCEFFLIMMHWIPLNLIILKLTLLM